jgi:formamidopyrimidine-DNA glycosylase
MPELPEVETIARGLRATIVGRVVRKVQLLHPGIARFHPPAGMAGQGIVAVDRRAKLLRIYLENGWMAVAHLKMSGRLWVTESTTALPKHTHVRALLDDDAQLLFVDPRRFGFFGLLTLQEWQQWPFARTLGPEPLETPPEILASRFTGRRAIKAVLLDQRTIAGVGNIYADESLFAAGIHPATLADALTSADRHRLAQTIRQILQEAIHAGGSTISDYRNAMGATGLFQERFAVYGRTGLPCTHCHTPLARSQVAGRSTVWCPQCQPLA